VSYLHLNDPILKVAYNEFQSERTANLASFIGFITDEYNMMKNSFRNLRSGTKRMLRKATTTTSTPAVIVGSGPSLEQNLEHLKRVRDSVIIISSGSNLRVLLENGIRPDFHCNLERARSILTRHEELIADGYGDDLKKIYAVMTTTIWPGIDAYFRDAIYFFRPALSPVGVFCEDADQILNNEGPQVTNTAFAIAKRIGVREIYLLGVDLGAVDPDQPRATAAWQGIRPRYLTMPVRGNFGRTVFTDMALLQQRDTLQQQIAKINAVDGRVYNLSNGVRIEGAVAKRAEALEFETTLDDREAHLASLVTQFPVYTRERFLGDFKLVKHLETDCMYVGKPLREQYAPRLIRGSVLRMFMQVNSILLRVADTQQRDDVYEVLKPILIKNLRLIEREVYALADELEEEDEAFAVEYG
jgi:hypothetical protein